MICYSKMQHCQGLTIGSRAVFDSQYGNTQISDELLCKSLLSELVGRAWNKHVQRDSDWSRCYGAWEGWGYDSCFKKHFRSGESPLEGCECRFLNQFWVLNNSKEMVNGLFLKHSAKKKQLWKTSVLRKIIFLPLGEIKFPPKRINKVVLLCRLIGCMCMDDTDLIIKVKKNNLNPYYCILMR